MSGGGGYGPGVSGPSTTPCEKLIFETNLQSPKPAVIKRLQIKDILVVESKSKNGPIVVRHETYGEAGSLVAQMADLLRCIESGTSYKAEVLSINGGMVRVRVSPA